VKCVTSSAVCGQKQWPMENIMISLCAAFNSSHKDMLDNHKNVQNEGLRFTQRTKESGPAM